MQNKYKKFLPTTAAIIVVAALSFYVGTIYSQKSATGTRQQFAQQFRQREGIQGGFISGKVLSKDVESITVQTRDGSSHIVLYSGSTAVVKPVPGSINDISAGTEVVAGGTQNSDGSITAQSIQVRQNTAIAQ